jgi:hypothetical protein
MAKQPSEEEDGDRVTPTTSFSELKKQIAERNDRAHKEAQELREARERKQLGIVARHRLDLDR